MSNSQSDQKGSAEVFEDTGHSADQRILFHPPASTKVTGDPFVSLMFSILYVSMPIIEVLTRHFVLWPRKGLGPRLTPVVC